MRERQGVREEREEEGEGEGEGGRRGGREKGREGEEEGERERGREGEKGRRPYYYLKDLLVGRHLLERDEAVQHNEFHIVVTLLHNQFNIALRGSLWNGSRVRGWDGSWSRYHVYKLDLSPWLQTLYLCLFLTLANLCEVTYQHNPFP